MPFPVLPVLASVAAFAIFRRKKRSKSDAIIVIQGASSDHVSLETGERLSIHFLESPGEEWRMVDAPDGFLMGTAKVEWEPAPGERKLKAFNFSAKRAGKTKAEFVMITNGSSGNRSEIEIEIS